MSTKAPETRGKGPVRGGLVGKESPVRGVGFDVVGDLKPPEMKECW